MPTRKSALILVFLSLFCLGMASTPSKPPSTEPPPQTTPPPVVTPPPASGSELAITSVNASSSNKSYPAPRSIDKNTSTYWQGNWSIFTKTTSWWLVFDLGKTYSLSKTSIFWNNTYGSTKYSIQGSADNKTWVNLQTNQSSAGGKANPYQKDHNLSGLYRYIRIYLNNASKNYPVIYEVQVDGSPPDTTPPTISIAPVKTPTNQNITLSYTVSDNVTVAGKITVTGDNSPYTKEGSYKVTLTAKDEAGNASSASVSFTIDKAPPVIVIASPENGAVLEEEQAQLQGTVDGVVFSENRTLIDGPNTLTKSATDAAGNSASASITVNYYSGQLVGPEGGEVTSTDGRVKVIIPPGALDKPTRIKVSTDIDKNILSKFNSSGKTLLSVVRCERNPDGNFNKPVTLIYTLEQAQVPGTPVVLGIYDSKDKTISVTGDPSFVPEDGVTLTFKIGHFSTYGALQGLISQGAPIGGGVKIPLPDMFTGSFSHSVAITVPPGRKGMQPSLGLNYRSSNSNSWVGVGFSLNPGYIVRSTRLGPPKYNDDDTFYLVTDGGTTEMTKLTEKLYQAKIESSFTKFYKEDDGSWRVVAKDGSKLLFGDSADSREVSSKGTFAWYLTEAQDTNGNYIEYKYYPKDTDNRCYLQYVYYTGNKNGTSPMNRAEFVLEPRNDVFSSYISGSKILTAKRLRQIKVTVDSEPVWTYDLAYNDSPSTGRSQLISVTQRGSDNKTLPVQEFEYQSAK